MRRPYKGTYALLLHLDRPESIRVGRLGEFAFSTGWYVYVGSAHGPGGLAARLARHRRRAADGKCLRWHVDYLRERAHLVEVWSKGGRPSAHSSQRLECEWARVFADAAGAEIPIPRFGASDCRCPAHLFYFATHPVDALSRALSESPDPDARWRALAALRIVGTSQAIAAISAALSDPDEGIRAGAAVALGELRAVESAPALVRCLADASPLVANRATEALERIGEEAVPALCAALTDERDAVRVHAAKALAAIQSPQSIIPLCQAYLHDPNYLVQHYAAETLTAMGVIEMVAVS
jgi:Uri superfamily endonuclease